MRTLIRNFFLFSILIIILASCSSMRTTKSQFEHLDQQLITRDYSAAIQELEAAKESAYKKKDRVVYYLDLGMLYHFDKQYAKSNEYLTNAENAIEELFTKSVSKIATSYVLNDNALDYTGEDYEDIYLNIFKALNYIKLNDYEGGFVEVRKVNNKLNMLEDKHKKTAKGLSKLSNKLTFAPAKNKFHNSALARYLSMLLYSFENQFDDARIDAKKIDEAFKLQSHIYKFSKPEIELKSTSDKVLINFISFTGKSPDKKAKTLYIHTEKDRIFIANSAENKKGNQKIENIDEYYWPGTKAGYHYKFQFPYFKEKESQIKFVRLNVNGKMMKDFALIENISKVALETFAVKKPLVYLKSLLRALVKGWASDKAKEKMDKEVGGGLAGKLLGYATDIAVDATENADLRISRLFPGKAMIGQIQLKPGTYTFEIEYLSKEGNVLWKENLGEKNIDLNGHYLFESYYLY